MPDEGRRHAGYFERYKGRPPERALSAFAQPDVLADAPHRGKGAIRPIASDAVVSGFFGRG